MLSQISFPVFSGPDVFPALNELLKMEPFNDVPLVVLVDENSMEHCFPVLVENCPAFNKAEILEIDAGEKHKSIEVAARLWEVLAEMRIPRNALMVNLGGGVISDLGGFVASVYKRGINFINVPTTLLGQVDAGVGGKTGVDHAGLKNLVGSFALPKGVFIHAGFLKTLPREEILSGMGEMLKHALIADPGYWERLKTMPETAGESWNSLIEHSINIKLDIIRKDFYESDQRKLLNFGHTIGHGIESLSLQKLLGRTVTHGEAVVAGMVCEAVISCRRKLLTPDELDEICGTLQSRFTPVELEDWMTEKIIEAIGNDKKNTGEEYSCTLVHGIGKGETGHSITGEEITYALNYYRHSTFMLNQD